MAFDNRSRLRLVVRDLSLFLLDGFFGPAEPVFESVKRIIGAAPVGDGVCRVFEEERDRIGDEDIFGRNRPDGFLALPEKFRRMLFVKKRAVDGAVSRSSGGGFRVGEVENENALRDFLDSANTNGGSVLERQKITADGRGGEGAQVLRFGNGEGGFAVVENVGIRIFREEKKRCRRMDVGEGGDAFPVLPIARDGNTKLRNAGLDADICESVSLVILDGDVGETKIAGKRDGFLALRRLDGEIFEYGAEPPEQTLFLKGKGLSRGFLACEEVGFSLVARDAENGEGGCLVFHISKKCFLVYHIGV